MSRFFLSLGLILGGLLVPPPAFAREEAASLAECAWLNVPSSALLLVDKRARQGTIYDDLDNPNAGPFYRIYAACGVEKRALLESVDSVDVSYRLLRELRRSKPANVGQDLFVDPIFRCEAKFADQAEDTSPSMVWWGFGEDRFASQLGSKASLFNSQVTISAEDFLAVEKRGNGAANFAELLKQTEEQEKIEVETHAEGMASGKAFRIKPVEQNTSCQILSPDGSLIDA